MFPWEIVEEEEGVGGRGSKGEGGWALCSCSPCSGSANQNSHLFSERPQLRSAAFLGTVEAPPGDQGAKNCSTFVPSVLVSARTSAATVNLKLPFQG